jgi:predicted DNA-binding ribbon-helix-helix protein
MSMLDNLTDRELNLYSCRSRSMRIDGTVTSIRLENIFWQILDHIAAAACVTTNRLIATVCADMAQRRGAVPNVSSLLRVTCARHLMMRSTPRDAHRQDQENRSTTDQRKPTTTRPGN